MYHVQKGAKVQNRLAAKYGEEKVLFQRTDLTSHWSVAAAFAAFGDQVANSDAVDVVVVNAAGIYCDSSWESQIDVNLIVRIHVYL